MCVAFDAMAFQQHDPIPASAASGRPSERVPLFAEIARDFRKSHRVRPGPLAHALARHPDTPMHVVELGDRVRVRIEHAAELRAAWCQRQSRRAAMDER